MTPLAKAEQDARAVVDRTPRNLAGKVEEQSGRLMKFFERLSDLVEDGDPVALYVWLEGE